MTPPDRPLVTFALFAFNQEKFIRAAAEAALAQTYSPLEIILSDDCSTDGTFRIMQDLVHQYEGPHTVRLIQTHSNVGTLAHVMNSVKLSKGKFLVLAAGDDISYPNRVSLLVEEWSRCGAWGLFSRFDCIDDAGNTLSKNEASLMPSGLLRSYFPGFPNLHLIHGATSAYDRRVFEYVSDFDDLRVLHEDAVLSFVLNLNRLNIKFVESSLVQYRAHTDSISNKRKQKHRLNIEQILLAESRAAKYAPSLTDLNVLFLRLVRAAGVDVSEGLIVDINAIKRDLAFFRFRGRWMCCGVVDRLKFFFSADCVGRRKWLLPRLFGVRFFAFTKSALEWVRTCP